MRTDSTDRIEDAERTAFCKVISDAQNGTGPFSGKKLSPSNPVIAYVHGHTHNAPTYHPWTCPSPYGSITIPQFDAGTPLYENADNGPGRLQFTVIRIGSHTVEAVGVRAPASNPTGAWTYAFKERLSIVNDP